MKANAHLQFLLAALALTAPSPATGAEPLATATHWVDTLRHPVDWISWGAEIRLRHEYYDNCTALDQQSLNDEVSYQRYRTRVWAAIKPSAPLTLNVRMVTESRWYLKPDLRKGARLDEFLWDTANLAFGGGQDHSLTLVLGRQDLVFGNQWLFHDGTTSDGSRSDFFDAARLVYEQKDWHTIFNLAGFDQTSAADKHLPMINDLEKPLNAENSRGLLLYLINHSVPNTQIDSYFVYKHDQRVEFNGNNGNLYLFGGRLERKLSEHWSLRGEFAQEFGDKNGQTRNAFGCNSRLGYELNDALQNSFTVSFEHLSGNDPDTGHDEGFDPLWGRRAQFSELLVPTFGAEAGGRRSEWTNWQRLGAGWSIKPTKRLEWLAGYHALWANENPLRGTPGYSWDGSFRGHLATGTLKYTFNEYLSGHLWAEAFFPGNYYADPKGDMATFFRAQLMFKF